MRVVGRGIIRIHLGNIRTKIAQIPVRYAEWLLLIEMDSYHIWSSIYGNAKVCSGNFRSDFENGRSPLSGIKHTGGESIKLKLANSTVVGTMIQLNE